MRIVEPPRPNREYHPYIVPEIQADELADAEEPLPVDQLLAEETDALVEAIEHTEIEAEAVVVVLPPEVKAEEEEFASELMIDPEPLEPPPAEVIEAPQATAELSPSEKRPSEPPPRKGKRRRRSGRKRSRGPDPQGGGGG